jgi:hypothetical protein
LGNSKKQPLANYAYETKQQRKGTNKMTTQKFYDLCDTAPEYAEDTAHLFSWCEGNYNFPAPSSLFLDLVKYSEDHFGENLTSQKMPDLGYLEIDLLAKALMEYAKRPNDVRDFVDKLMNNYSEEEED